MPENSQSENDADDTDEADRRNGEPAATENHQTGVDQAAENQKNDPPA